MPQSSRGRSQDRRRVAGGQDYEVRYEAKKTGSSKKQVKKAIHKVGNSRRKVEKQFLSAWLGSDRQRGSQPTLPRTR